MAINSNEWNQTITVSKVSRTGNYGGAMFWGSPTDGESSKNETINIIGNWRVFPKPVFVDKGDVWKINGTATKERRKLPNGFTVKVTKVTATSAELIKPSELPLNETLLAVPGIGEGKINNLLSVFDELSLRSIIETRDTSRLNEVLTPQITDRLLDWWDEYGKKSDYYFFRRFNFTPKTTKHIIQFFAPQAKNRLADNPYALLSLTDNFSIVDSVAIAGYGIDPTDHRRLYALAEKSLYDMLEDGHTATTEGLLKKALSKNLQKLGVPSITVERVRAIWNSKCDRQVFHDKDNGLIIPLAAYSIEKDIFNKIHSLINKSEPSLLGGIHQPTETEIDDLLDEFNTIEEERLTAPIFTLNKEQRQAVHASLNNRMCLITGDAGTGKTSVLRALYHVLDFCSFTYYQQAISGKATKRMRDATDRHDESYTVAGFLKNVNKISDTESCYVIIDEAAMLDVWNLWKVINTLGSRVRLIFVGDPGQLPPVGPGKTLHLFSNCKAIPQVTLIEIVRQGAGSKIPVLSRAMRIGEWAWNKDTPLAGVEIIQCSNTDIAKTVLKQYDLSPDDTQILSATYKNKWSGIDKLNADCQARYNKDAKKLLLFNTYEDMKENSGFRIGDPLLMMRNDWDRDLANGSMGELTELYDTPLEFEVSGKRNELALGLATWDDGDTQPIFLSDIQQENISLAYCMSVHKAQGSEFPRIIIPVNSTSSKIIDRCWLYTAVTRAKLSVTLVGSIDRMQQVVKAEPAASKRITGLEAMLRDL